MDLKIVVLGDEAVGKSSLLAEQYFPYTRITTEPEMKTRQVTINDKIIKVEFWDMPGRRELKSCVLPHLRGSDCCVIVYDVTSVGSYESLEYWREEFLAEIALPDGQWFPFVVVGNKVDLNHRMVNEEMIASWCSAKEVFSYFEISAKTPTDVTDALRIIVNNAYENKLKRASRENDDVPNKTSARPLCCCFSRCTLL